MEKSSSLPYPPRGVGDTKPFKRMKKQPEAVAHLVGSSNLLT